MKTDFKEEWIIRVALIVVTVMLLLRFVPAMWGSLLLFGGVAIIGGIAYLVYRRFFVTSKQEEKAEDEVFVRINGQMNRCASKANQYRTEANDIRHRHRQLADQLEKSDHSLQDNAREKAVKILADLDSELGLRLAKATFFEESEQRLAEMLEAHKLHRELIKSELKLEEWRSENYTDIAGMETMKDRIEQEKTKLDTISELTHRASVSQDLNHTERLREKLKSLLS